MKIENFSDLVADIPSLPVVAARILHIIADDNSSLEELIKVVSLDQSFSSRFLRIANSPYYRRGKSVGDIAHAVLRIGFTTVKALVFAASLKDLRRSSDRTDMSLWEHNLGVSIGSTVIASETGLLAAGVPLIHGLLHDIGKVLINLAMRDRYAEVIQEVAGQKIPFIEAERRVLGYDHCEVGAYVAKHWGLPNDISFVIANHHEEELLQTIKDASLKKIILTVKAADVLCSMMGIGLAQGKDLTEEEWKYLKLSSPKKRDPVIKKIAEEYPHFRDFVMGHGSS